MGRKTHMLGDHQNLALNKSQTHCSNPETANSIGVITGHLAIRIHAKTLNIPSNSFCQIYKDEEEAETSEHLLYHCTKFAVQLPRTSPSSLAPKLGNSVTF